MGFEVFLTAIVTGCHYKHFTFVAGGVAFPLEIDVADDGLPLADPNDNCCSLRLDLQLGPGFRLGGGGVCLTSDAEGTTALFSEPGYYVVYLFVSDGELTESEQIVVCADLPADVNNDNTTNEIDLMGLSQYLLSSCILADDWCSGADIDQSGSVRLEDFSYFARFWLQTSEDRLQKNLIAHWVFDQSDGGIAMDSALHPAGPFPAVLLGSPSWQDDDVSRGTGALTFNASDDYLDAGFQPVINGLGDLSVTAWIKLDPLAAPDRRPIIGNEGHGQRGFSFRVENGNLLRFQIYQDNTPGNSTDIFSDQALETDTWYHVAFTYAFIVNDLSQVRLYPDGDLTGSSDTAKGPMNASNTHALEIGHYFWNAQFNWYYKGVLDDMRIYDRLLSEDDIYLLSR